MQNTIRLMLVALLSQGHVLLEGNPGLGKTTLAKAFAETIGGNFRRIQMTPDTLPADILGSYVFDQKTATFELRKGPIFGNVILVDELNRATPKAQSALIEVMQERQVSFERETISLEEPFMVLSTQVHFGSPGTYPLSEVQSDRFAFSIEIGYPSMDDEVGIISKIDSIESGKCSQLLSPDQVLAAIAHARGVFVSESVKKYIVSLSDFIRKSEHLRMAPGARTSVVLYKGSRALASLQGRDFVIPDDVKFLVPYVLRHRLTLKAEALAEEITPDQLITELLEKVPVPKEPAPKV